MAGIVVQEGAELAASTNSWTVLDAAGARKLTLQETNTVAVGHVAS